MRYLNNNKRKLNSTKNSVKNYYTNNIKKKLNKHAENI